MSALEEWQQQRIVTIAVMAATLEAGDRAHKPPRDDARPIETTEEYAERAVKLFDAVDRQELPR